jgi:hypothetical protein
MKASVGTSCGRCTASFYEFFTTSSLFDLAGRSMTMSDIGGAYSVAETPVAFVPAAGTNLALTFSSQATVTLPFTLPYPGGSTTQLRICSSGYVSPGQNPVQLVPTPASFLQGSPRWAACWSAFSPAAGGNNVWYDATPSRAIVTWNAVPMIGGSAPSTFQIQFFPNGTVHVVWQNLAASAFTALTGWTTGGGFLDPGTRDLSATLSTPYALCSAPFDGLSLDASARPVLGTTLQWQLGGVQAGTGWGALMRSLTQALPAVDLTAAGMPGCFAHVVAPEATVVLAPTASVQLPETIPNNTALIGVTLVGQAVTFNPSLTPLGLVASNAMVLTLGM